MSKQINKTFIHIEEYQEKIKNFNENFKKQNEISNKFFKNQIKKMKILDQKIKKFRKNLKKIEKIKKIFVQLI